MSRILASLLSITLGVFILYPRLSAAEAEEKTSGKPNVKIKMMDNLTISGRLLAVEEKNLVILDTEKKQITGLKVSEISWIKLRKSNRIPRDIWMGGLLGIIPSAILSKDSEYSAVYYMFFIPVCSAWGTLVGVLEGLTERIDICDLSPSELRRTLHSLKRYALFPQGNLPPGSTITPLPTLNLTVASPPSSRHKTRLFDRLRIVWSPFLYTLQGKISITTNTQETGHVEFDPITGKTDFTYTIIRDNLKMDPDESPTPGFFQVNYEITPHVSTGIEWSRIRGVRTSMEMTGAQIYSIQERDYYKGFFASENILKFSPCLLSLSWKPWKVTFYQKHILELGIAAGPVLNYIEFRYRESGKDCLSKRTFSIGGKIRLAYDYFFNEKISMGVAAEYLSFDVTIPRTRVNYDETLYNKINENGSYIKEKNTALNIPGRKLGIQSFHFGLRLGCSF